MSDPGASNAAIRAEMGIPSTDSLRGQRDGIGFAREAADMAAVVRASDLPPRPHRFYADAVTPPAAPAGSSPAVSDLELPLIGAICPHDDYLYAGRVYREIVPLVTAPVLVLIGVFHRYARFGIRDHLVFDPYPAWRTPDGPVPVSPLRDAWRRRLDPGDWIESAPAHDAEHSVEALAYWLRHDRPDREIVPVLIPGANLARLRALAERAGQTLAEIVREQGWRWGRDIAVVISADAVHYGADFAHVPFGSGGEKAYARATARDRELMERFFSGPVEATTVERLFETFVDPSEPDRYRLPWCGRFSIPFGLELLRAIGKRSGWSVEARPVAYGTSIDPPALILPGTPLGTTAPATLEHFVGHPAVAFGGISRDQNLP